MDLPVKTVILALGLLTFGENHDMETPQHRGPQLVGEAVTVSYAADPSVGYGRFRLENHEAVAVTAAVESAWLELGALRQPLAGVTVFDLDQDRMLDPARFTIAAKATLTFLVGFPRVAHEPRFGESSAVGLRLTVNGNGQQAVSPLVFVRRVP